MIYDMHNRIVNIDWKKEALQRYFFLLVIMILFVGLFLTSGNYIKKLQKDYQEYILQPEELYGIEKQNLKDFILEEEYLISTTNDPWIEYDIGTKVMAKVIELDFDGVKSDDCWGTIFNTDTWEYHTYYLKNGKVLVYYDEPEELQHLRFDLVSSQSICFKLERIIINSSYGLKIYAVKQIIPLVILCVSAFWGLAQVIYFIKRKEKRKGIVITGILAVLLINLSAIMYQNIFLNEIEQETLLWMILVSSTFSMLTLIRNNNKENSERRIWKEDVKKGLKVILSIIIFALLQVEILELLTETPYNFERFSAGMWNIVIIFLLLNFGYLFMGNLKASMVFVNIFVSILAICNHYFYQFRGNPFELSDCVMAATAVNVIGNYKFGWDDNLSIFLLIELGLICWFQIIDFRRKWTKRSVAAGCLSGGVLVLMVTFYTPGVSYWDQIASARDLGYLNSFVAYARRDLTIEKPEGYSKSVAESILAKYEEEIKVCAENEGSEEKKLPNIIVLMDEAFADLPLTYGFDTDIDGMPFIHSLMENTVKGNLKVSIFGGSTANTEYEFLTGNTLAFLHAGSVPYMQYVKKPQASLASELKKLGYHTIAFHPENPSNYNRNTVYPNLGFDTFISKEDNLEFRESLRGYMTDSADMMNVMEIYESQKGSEPLFLFNVTMQNHGDYNRNESPLEAKVKTVDEELQYTQLLEYLALIKKTDEAFESLISYFEKQENKVIVLMFGDHQPGLDSEIYAAIGSNANTPDASLEEREKMYTVPFIMWANYDIDEEENVLISPGFLRSMLLEKAGVEMSAYDKFLAQCRGEYSAINFIGYYDRDGNLKACDGKYEGEEGLREYWILQYENMFGK